MSDVSSPASPSPGHAAAPRPVLSVFDGVMIIVGIIIGGGIFTFPPLVAGMTGSVEWMFGAWLFGATLALIGALCYAELATTFPNAGGDYYFLTRAYGKDLSFFFAWARVLVITTGSIALLAFVFGDYMSRVFWLGAQSSTIYAVLIVVALTAVNIAGLKESARTQNLLSGLLVLGMLMVVIAGFVAPATGAAPAPAASNAVPTLFGTALLFVLFTFGGWNEAAYISAEVRGGPRSIVKVLLLALLLVTSIYVLFVAALLVGLGFDGLKSSQAVAADVARNAFGTFGEKTIGAVVALAALTSINATMIVAARTNYSLGNDWPVFRFMSRWNSERDAPVAAYLVTGAISLTLVLLATVNKSGVKFMVDFTAPVFWFFFLLTGIALFVLRFRQPHVARPFKVPAYPVLPMTFRRHLRLPAVPQPPLHPREPGGAGRAVRDGGRCRGLDHRAVAPTLTNARQSAHHRRVARGRTRRPFRPQWRRGSSCWSQRHADHTSEHRSPSRPHARCATHSGVSLPWWPRRPMSASSNCIDCCGQRVAHWLSIRRRHRGKEHRLRVASRQPRPRTAGLLRWPTCLRFNRTRCVGSSRRCARVPRRPRRSIAGDAVTRSGSRQRCRRN